jgi:alpha-galactosidase
MKKLATEIKAMGVRPGIWLRPLHNKDEAVSPEMRILRGGERLYLDPTHPDVQNYIRADIERIREWGYELIKHDFSQCDMFGHFGWDLNGAITNYKEWSFYDKKKTGAEITLDFYRLIKETAGDIYILGSNTISHLSAGLVEISRTGTDTSGKCWSVTRMNGVNTLAFRMCQNDAFYKVDADCVGLMADNIPWKLNRQWLDLVSKSGSPLFVSMQPSVITPEIFEDLKKAFKINSVQENTAEPLDWMYNNQPQKWLIDGEETEYDFVMDSPPRLLGYKIGDLSSTNMF